MLGTLFGLYPFLRKLYADSGYQGVSTITLSDGALVAEFDGLPASASRVL
jgi:hypothetical protein